jgi:hypothetical protein
MCHEAGVGEHPGCHENGTDDEHGTTTPAVHVDESRNCHEDVDNILNGGSDEVDVASETGLKVGQ